MTAGEESDDDSLQAEVDRALRETRSALGKLAEDHRLCALLMSVSTLIDSVEVEVTSGDGGSAFLLREEERVIEFRSSTLRRIIQHSSELAREVGRCGR